MTSLVEYVDIVRASTGDCMWGSESVKKSINEPEGRKDEFAFETENVFPICVNFMQQNI